jgi:Family of unknown function (DUF6152)
VRKLLTSLVALSVLSANMAVAHHSFAMFDGTKLVVLKGTMVKFSFLSPHSWISVIGSPDGAGPPVQWDIEATAPMVLTKIGITQDSLKAGDKVTLGIRPLRDGRNGGSLVFVVTADGQTHGVNPAELGLNSEQLKP